MRLKKDFVMNNEKIKQWLKTHTFHHSQFNEIKKLIDLKEKNNFKISVCFPTLNEEKTIGKEVVIIKSELQNRYPLVDEIAVIDSGSTDKTKEIASEFGAKVLLASDYLKEEGDLKGKGENLWKAIYLLEGDIIVYIDADISNIHPKFIYGLLGPILYNPKNISFVKAFYERPLKIGGTKSNNEGGRLTEILIRPLFAQFFPELTGIIQPLSGEFAGKREILEKLPFPIGYGVETSTLIDISQKFGLSCIAQTDLDLRNHRNQSSKALGRMSFGILQSFWNRLETYHHVKGLKLKNYFMNHVEIQDTINLISQKIKEHERKPMIEVKAYQKKKS